MNLARPDGTALYWTARGEGPTAVLSHGLFADHRLFDTVAEAIAEAGWRVVRWDLRAHGRSTGAVEKTSYADLVGDLRAVVEACGAQRVVLIGHELGGVLSLQLALDEPARVAALAAWGVDPAPTPVAQRVQASLLMAARQVSIRPFTLALEPLWMNRRAPSHDGTLAALQRRIASTLSGGALADVIEGTRGRPDLRLRLRDLAMPVLVQWGERDRLLRPNAGRELLAGVPHAEGGPVPEAAHMSWIDRPDVVVPQLRSWLSRLPPEPS